MHYRDEQFNSKERLRRRFDIIRRLIVAGAEVNHNCEAGYPDFHEALKTNSASIIEMFLERGADVCHSRGAGRTALHIAAEYSEPWVVARLLDNPDVDINIKTSYGAMTAMHIAVQNQKHDTMELLLERGANINAIGE